MTRQAWLLGFFSLSGQVLLLREVVTSFNGDELFIGTALFGWLLAVSLGSIVGGKVKSNTQARTLFVAGAVVLPLTLLALRLSPRAAGFVVGEVVGFGDAALISLILMMPVGVLSGWLFSSIVRSGHGVATSITGVYLWEGLGAFAAGVTISLAVGGPLSTIAIAIIVGGLVIIVSYAESTRKPKSLVVIVSAAAVVLLASVFAGDMDRQLDRIRYRPWVVEASFDTHYGHQTILSNSGALSVLTDNKVEFVYPDLNRVENLLIPPLLYRSSIKEVLITGQSELEPVTDSLATIRLSLLDPRRQLTQVLGSFVKPPERASTQIEDDPVAFMARGSSLGSYDLIIVDAGELNCYKNSRLVTPEFFAGVGSHLAADGLLLLPLDYDTDRYISAEVRKLLSIVYGTVRTAFDHVVLWPGNVTLLLASHTPIADLSVDSLVAAVTRLSYRPQYVNEFYLYDRLADSKRQRLEAAVTGSDDINSVNRPILPHYQAIYRADKGGLDRRLLGWLLGSPAWLFVLPAAVIVMGLFLSLGGRGRRRYGLFLYFVAGVVSLTLELVSFYLFQSMAGSLYSEMAALIGSFMLGLGLGTFWARRYGGRGLEFASLMLLLLVALCFLYSYDYYDPSVILYYHLAFQFVVAVATAGLFVAATNRYYSEAGRANRGLGYAVELAGSAVGGLISMTILLPVLGVQFLLLCVAGMVVLALLGSVLADRMAV